MNDRLKLIASHINDGTGVVDVGTDHGYLPIHLAKRGYSGKILASDINLEPIELARRNAKTEGVADRISFYHCDGLDFCDGSDIDTIVIAGMGGESICSILDRAEWCMQSRYKLILNPMSKSEVLRYWLCFNGFLIDSEELVPDNGMLYQVLTAHYIDKNMHLSDAEMYIGKEELISQSPNYLQILKKHIRRFERAVAELSIAERDMRDRVELYLEILAQFKDMENRYDKAK